MIISVSDNLHQNMLKPGDMCMVYAIIIRASLIKPGLR